MDQNAHNFLELTVCRGKPTIGQRLSINRDRDTTVSHDAALRSGRDQGRSVPARGSNTLGEGMPQPDAETLLGLPSYRLCEPGGPIALGNEPGPQWHRGGSPEPLGRDERLTESRSHSPIGDADCGSASSGLVLPVPLRVVMLYDMDACHGPTGVTRHALAQLERLSRRDDVALRLISGRMTPSGRPGILGHRSRAFSTGVAGPDPRLATVVAAQALAADRVVHRAGRLDLLPGGVCGSRATGPEGSDQP